MKIYVTRQIIPWPRYTTSGSCSNIYNNSTTFGRFLSLGRSKLCWTDPLISIVARRLEAWCPVCTVRHLLAAAWWHVLQSMTNQQHALLAQRTAARSVMPCAAVDDNQEHALLAQRTTAQRTARENWFQQRIAFQEQL